MDAEVPGESGTLRPSDMMALNEYSVTETHHWLFYKATTPKAHPVLHGGY